MRKPRWPLGVLFAVAGAPAIAQERPDTLVADSVYSDADVDKTVVQPHGALFLIYPRKQWQAGVEGCVIAQFVVAANGRVDMRTFKRVWSTHADFTLEVRRALMKAQCEPAELRGRNVRQLVKQPFQFTLTSSTGQARMPSPGLRPCQK